LQLGASVEEDVVETFKVFQQQLRQYSRGQIRLLKYSHTRFDTSSPETCG
jgi:hypothetical protein